MKIETTPLEDHQIRLTVEVAPETLEEAKRKVCRQYASRAKIPGFRPGRVPYQVVLRYLGEETVQEQAIETAAKEVYPQAIKEAAIEPFDLGLLEEVVSQEPLVLAFVIPLQPVITLPDYRAMRKPYEPKTINEEDVAKTLEDLRERQAIVEPADRPAQEGDIVYLHISGERVTPQEGQNSSLVAERSESFLIPPEARAESPDEWPFPGFSRQLCGLSAGDHRTLVHTFTADSPYESLRGVEAEFKFKVDEVKSHSLPDLNDEFAASIGEFTSLEDLRNKVRQGLETQAQNEYDQEYDTALVDDIISQSVMRYPPQMLESELEVTIDNLTQRLSQQGMDLDLYLKVTRKTQETLREEMKPVAETRLKRRLALLEIAKVEDLQADPEIVQAEVLETMSYFQSTMSEKDKRKLDERSVYNYLVGGVLTDILTRQAIERLHAIASGKLETAASESDLSVTSAALEEPLTSEPTMPPVTTEAATDDTLSEGASNE